MGVFVSAETGENIPRVNSTVGMERRWGGGCFPLPYMLTFPETANNLTPHSRET